MRGPAFSRLPGRLAKTLAALFLFAAGVGALGPLEGLSQETSGLEFVDVTDDLANFALSRFQAQDGPALLLTARDLIQRYGPEPSPFSSADPAPATLEVQVVGALLSPGLLRAFAGQFKERFVSLLRKRAHDRLGPERAALFLELGQAWTTELAQCVDAAGRGVDGPESGPPAGLPKGDCRYLRDWARGVLAANNERGDVLATASELLLDLSRELRPE